MEMNRGTSLHVAQSVATVGNVLISVKPYRTKDGRREVGSARGAEDLAYNLLGQAWLAQ